MPSRVFGWRLTLRFSDYKPRRHLSRGRTMWEALGIPPLVSIVSVGVLSLWHVTADLGGIRFWPMYPVPWSEVRHRRGKLLGIRYLKIVAGKPRAHHVLLGVRGGHEFPALVSKHAEELPS